MWKYIYIFLALALAGAVSFFGYRYFESYKSPAVAAINSIPTNVALFIEINKPGPTIKTLLKNSEIWNPGDSASKLQGLDEIYNEISMLDSLIQSDKSAAIILKSSKIIFAVLSIDSSKFGSLTVVAPTAGNGFSIDDFIIKNVGTITHSKYHEAELSRVWLQKPGAELYFSGYKGLLMFSFNEIAVKKAIDQLDSGTSLNSDKYFKKTKATAGKNADAHLFIQFSRFSSFPQKILGDNILQPDQVSGFANWMELDIVIKAREILLNGFSIADDSVSQYLNCFAQQPQQITIPEILPFDASVLLDLGFENFEDYLKKYTDYLYGTGHLKKFDKDLLNINNRYGIKLQKQFFPLVGSEVGLAFYGTNGNGKKNCYVFFKAKDIKTSKAFLDKLAIKASRKNGKDLFTKEHNEYLIKKIAIPGFAGAVFGPWFNCMEENYYIAIKDYVVMANDPAALFHLIDAFYLQKTLSQNFNYKTFSDNISESSNILFYCNTSKSFKYIHSFLNKFFSGFWKKNKKTLKSYEAFALQFSYSNKMFYTNFYVKYNPEFHEVDPSNWEVSVDAKIIGNPVLVRNFKTGNLNVLVTDELNNLYCIGPHGQIRWKTPLIEAPQSHIYVVDYFKNGKTQFLFNTENYFYLFDINGNPVDGFPYKLVTKATNGLSVYDYDNTRDYRLILSLEDNRVYNYNIDGKLVDGWSKIKARSKVPFPIEHIVANNKDYMFVTDDKGRITISNRRGEVRIRLKKKLIRAKNSIFYKNETNKKGVFITTNEKGKLTYISANGKLKYTDFGNFSTNHFFFYEDFDGDNSNDFIFIDKKNLTVFNKFKKILFKYSFNSEIRTKPVLFSINGINYIGIIEPSTNQIYIFDKNGQVFSQSKITGETSFVTGSLNNDKNTNLIICSGNKVINHLLEE